MYGSTIRERENNNRRLAALETWNMQVNGAWNILKDNYLSEQTIDRINEMAEIVSEHFPDMHPSEVRLHLHKGEYPEVFSGFEKLYKRYTGEVKSVGEILSSKPKSE